jgi:NUMOD4 motif
MPQISKQIIKDVIQTLDSYGCGAHHPDLLPLLDQPEQEPVAWRDVTNYESVYEVSSLGEIRNKSTGKVLAKNFTGAGYIKANLWKDG